MGKKKYIPTTTKHPMTLKWEGTKRASVELGGGRKMQVEPGMPAKSSQAYEGQAGNSMLFLPQGNKSKFVLSPQTIDRYFDRVRGGTQERNISVRDARGKVPKVETGGRREAEEINPKLLKLKNKETGEPMSTPQNIAAGDQYDLENLFQIVEEISTYNDDQLDEFMDQLDEQQIELIQAAFEYLQETQVSAMTAARHILFAKRAAKAGQELTPQQERDVRTAQELYPEIAQKVAAKIMGKTIEQMRAEDDRRTKREIERGAGTDEAGNIRYAQGMAVQGDANPDLRKKTGDDESTVVAKGVGAGVRGEDKPKKSRGGSKRGFGALNTALQGFKVPKGSQKAAREVGKMVNSSYETDQPQIVENVFVQSAIEGEVLDFTKTVRDALDYHAHSAIEDIKNSMMQVDENSDEQNDIVEYVTSLDANQLNEFVETLNQEEAEYVNMLIDERAKYGTAAGRKRLAKKIRAGKDIGKKGKHFEEIASKAAERYGSEERGRAVAAAAMWKKYGGKKGKK